MAPKKRKAPAKKPCDVCGVFHVRGTYEDLVSRCYGPDADPHQRWSGDEHCNFPPPDDSTTCYDLVLSFLQIDPKAEDVGAKFVGAVSTALIDSPGLSAPNATDLIAHFVHNALRACEYVQDSPQQSAFLRSPSAAAELYFAYLRQEAVDAKAKPEAYQDSLGLPYAVVTNLLTACCCCRFRHQLAQENRV